MHEKVVVVDGRRYITGGRNLAESYFGLAPRKNYVDRDVYVDGESAAEARKHFEQVWSSRHVAGLRVRVSAQEKRRAAQILDDVLAELDCERFIRLNSGTDWSAGQRDVDDVRFLHDPVSNAGTRVADRIAELLSRASHSIVVESPYLVPSKELLHILEKKLAEGVHVQIVTNSLRSTDGVLPFAGYLKYRRRLVRAGVDIREYKGPDPLHAKSIVVDSRIVLIGSYNVDPRSENLNTEVMSLAEDEQVAVQLLESIDLHVENSWRPRQMPVPAGDAPRVSRAKTFRAWTARLFLPFFENQL
jgi:putative cardiolipin synthase